MDNNNHLDIDCDHVVFEPSLIERRISPSLSNQSCVNFKFEVKLKRLVVLQNTDGSIEPFADPDLNTTHISTKLMFKDFTLMSEIRESLLGALVSLNLWEEERDRLVRCAWDAATAACLESVRNPHMSGCVDIDLEFELLLEHQFVLYSGSDEGDYSMLKKYDKDSEDQEDERCYCCICLEDLLGQVLCTPCHHLFHGDCIKNWLCLCTTPSCPVCRFRINTKMK